MPNGAGKLYIFVEHFWPKSIQVCLLIYLVFLCANNFDFADEVLNYFKIYGPKYVEWIDDSCCNIVFPDQVVKRNCIYKRNNIYIMTNIAKLLYAHKLASKPFFFQLD